MSLLHINDKLIEEMDDLSIVKGLSKNDLIKVLIMKQKYISYYESCNILDLYFNNNLSKSDTITKIDAISLYIRERTIESLIEILKLDYSKLRIYTISIHCYLINWIKEILN
jgi:hypothetical protein